MFLSFFGSFFTKGKHRQRGSNPQQNRRLLLEQLEDRKVPALFAPATNFFVGDQPIRVVAGDFNGDGKQDLATVLSSNTASVNMLLGDGKGGFSAAPGSPFPVGFDARNLAAADFNGDHM